MSEEGVELERIYTINLKRVMLAPRWRRTVRAINLIKEFAKKHMKASEVKISEEVNRLVWARGVESPPRRLTLRMVKDKEGVVTVSPAE